ncbi:MAG: energy-coupling factor transporter transmembrane component T, partial [Bacillota bacterium]|nr:energy-coupling factor transporter transmembrane component T [Bacillota bacterium]
QLLIIQLLFCREGTLLWQWGIIRIYSQALPNAVLGYLRTSALAYGAVQFISWTSSQDGVLMLKSFGLPYRYAMLVGVAARFFPLMQKEYTAITQSQAVRGLDSTGIWRRLKALPPTFFPLLYRAMRRSSDTALSMELRGFGLMKERTFAKELSFGGGEKAMVVLFTAIMLTLIFYKIMN